MSMEQERGIENSIIECTGVCKSFETPEGEHQVIKDFNLQAKENEFLVLFGPGQCGKTTMINLIAGFEKVSGGSLKFMGKEIAKPDPSRGVVFQSTALFPWMTTMGNVEYGLKMAGVKNRNGKSAPRIISIWWDCRGSRNLIRYSFQGGCASAWALPGLIAMNPR